MAKTSDKTGTLTTPVATIFAPCLAERSCTIPYNHLFEMKKHEASHTARFVSNGIYWVSQHGHLACEVPAELGAYTDAMTCRLELGQGTLRKAIARQLLLMKSALLQAASMPGIYLYQLLRKRYIESVARATLGNEVQQVVVIGAGFDTLSLRLSADMPGYSVIEIDHPATQRVKKEVLEDFSLSRSDVQFVPVDLSQESLADTLFETDGYDPRLPTLFIMEGVTMYLDESRVRDLLDCIASQAPGSKFLFTYMEESTPGCYDFQNSRAATRWWLALRNERFTWGVGRSQLSEFLAQSGFRLLEHRTPEDLRSELLTESNRDAVLAQGENTALASL